MAYEWYSLRNWDNPLSSSSSSSVRFPFYSPYRGNLGHTQCSCRSVTPGADLDRLVLCEFVRTWPRDLIFKTKGQDSVIHAAIARARFSPCLRRPNAKWCRRPLIICDGWIGLYLAVQNILFYFFFLYICKNDALESLRFEYRCFSSQTRKGERLQNRRNLSISMQRPPTQVGLFTGYMYMVLFTSIAAALEHRRPRTFCPHCCRRIAVAVFS